jgi:hypothetical protein
LLAFAALAAPASAQEEGRRGRKEPESGVQAVSSRSLATIARLGKEIEDAARFYDISYTVKDDKGKPKQEKALLKIADDVAVFYDRQIRLDELEPGQTVRILGRVVEREVQGRGGQGGGSGGAGGAGGAAGAGGFGGSPGGKDRQIQNARAILVGEETAVNESYKDAKDKSIRWVTATVSLSSSGLWVTYSNEEYRVTLDRKAPIIRREKAADDKERKLLKKAQWVHVLGKPADARPRSKSRADAEKPCFESTRVVLLDARLVATVYPALFE